MSATRAAFRQCWSIRRPASSPAQRQPGVEMPGDCAGRVLQVPEPLPQCRVGHHHHPADHVRVAARYFVVEWTIAPRQREWLPRYGEATCRRRRAARLPRAPRRRGRDVRDGQQRVGGRLAHSTRAGRSASAPRTAASLSGTGRCPPPSREHPGHQPERPAVRVVRMTTSSPARRPRAAGSPWPRSRRRRPARRAALERGQALLQGPPGGVRGPRYS